MIINIGDEILKIQALGLLDKPLADKTTKKNMGDYGMRYERNQDIASPLITGTNADVIKTRSRKAMKKQSERTRQHTEVFTPLWIDESASIKMPLERTCCKGGYI